MKPTIVTIGVYGFDEQNFFQALQRARIDTLCDIRARRGVRGSEYTFANSERLQQKLAGLNIRYLHLKQLAPSDEIRQMQAEEDRRAKVARRKRSRLGEAFQEAYKQNILKNLDAQDVLRQMGEGAKRIALLCVEREPEACHRSLLAAWLRERLGVPVEHITP
jgi:uncharacterized protein (DUF488 family)